MDDIQRLQAREFCVDILHLKLDDRRPVCRGFGTAFLKERHGFFRADGQRCARRHDLCEDGGQPVGFRARDGFVEGHKTPDIPRNEADRSKFHRHFLFCRPLTGRQRF